MVLPPFFSFVHGEDGYRSLRAPWPFIRQLDDGDKHQRHWWPFYGVSLDERRREWYTLWPIVSGSTAEQSDHRIHQFQVAPFYFQETRERIDAAQLGPPAVTARYRRLWPLFSWQRSERGSRLRVPELSLFRMSEPIERNWAPLWSLFVRQKRADGARLTDFLWGLASWGQDDEARHFLQVLWVFNFRSSGPAGPAAAQEVNP